MGELVGTASKKEIIMHALTISLTCVTMILAPAIVVLSGRQQPEEEIE